MADYNKIKVVSIDIDGTLTDGLYQVNGNRNVVKSFYTRDFCGIQMLLEADIKVVILTQSHDIIINAQVNRIASHSQVWEDALRSNFVRLDNDLVVETACDNKKEFMNDYLIAHKLTLENLAHMGDAENDIELLKVVGIAVCPADAIEDIDDVDYRCEKNGGRGAVYEFCRHLLAMKDK